MIDKLWHNTLVCDWDGVVEVFPHVDPPAYIEGVKEAFQAFMDAGWFIDIYSGGSDDPRRLDTMKTNMHRWFGTEFWITYVEADRISFPVGRKPGGKIYLDDRGLKFEGWDSFTPEDAEKFRAWWQHPASDK